MTFKILVYLAIYFSCWSTIWGQHSQKERHIKIKSDPPGAAVYIEGSLVGITPCELSFDIIGKYRLRAFKKGYENWRSTIFFDSVNNNSLNIKLSSKTPIKAALRSLIFPGWGQGYSDKEVKGAMIKIIQASSIITTIFFELQYRNAIENYDKALKNYNFHKQNFEEKDKYWLIVEDKNQITNSLYKKRNIALWTTGVIWLYNVLDAIFAFPTYYEKILENYSLNLSCQIYENNPHLVISKTFNLN